MRNNMRNIQIREAAIRAGLRMWQIARAMGIAPETLSRKLRDELKDDERDRILAVIDDLAAKY